MKRQLAQFFLLLILIGGYAYSKKDPLVGTWTSNSEVLGIPGTSEATFHSDGRYSSITTMEGQTGKGLRVPDIGTWKLSEDGKLTIQLSDIQWETIGASMGTPTRVQNTLQSSKAALIDEVNRMGAVEVKWDGEDLFSLTFAGTAQTYKRKS